MNMTAMRACSYKYIFVGHFVDEMNTLEILFLSKNLQTGKSLEDDIGNIYNYTSTLKMFHDQSLILSCRTKHYINNMEMGQMSMSSFK